MRRLLRLHLAIVVVASSYLTLGVFAPTQARNLWAPYALLMFTLAVVNLLNERHRIHARSS